MLIEGLLKYSVTDMHLADLCGITKR